MYSLLKKLLTKSIDLLLVFILSPILLFRRRYEAASAVSKIKDGLSISFVCRGNIIRSVFAEHLYNKYTGDNKASSFSTLNYNFRNPPLNALKESKNYLFPILYERVNCLNDIKDTNDFKTFLVNFKRLNNQY